MRFIIYFLISLNIVFGNEIYAIFNVVSIKDSKLMIETSGIVNEIYVSIGSKVKKGAKLLSLRNTDKIYNLEMQKAQLNGAKEQYLFAKRQYERYQNSGDAIDENSLDKFYSSYKQLEFSYLQLQNGVKLQEEILKRTTLYAPFDGIIASKNIELGDGVNPNATILFRLISEKKKLVLEFDSKYISEVKIGNLFKYQINSKEFYGKITKIYPIIDEKTRKVKAEVLLDMQLEVGMFGDGYIQTKSIDKKEF